MATIRVSPKQLAAMWLLYAAPEYTLTREALAKKGFTGVTMGPLVDKGLTRQLWDPQPEKIYLSHRLTTEGLAFLERIDDE